MSSVEFGMTDDNALSDAESMAVCLLAAERQIVWRQAKYTLFFVMLEEHRSRYLIMAQAALDHIGYLHSKVRARIRAQLPLDASVS